MFDTDYSEKKFLKMKEYNFKKELAEKDAEMKAKIDELKKEITELQRKTR